MISHLHPTSKGRSFHHHLTKHARISVKCGVAAFTRQRRLRVTGDALCLRATTTRELPIPQR
ncbi:MAG: hypothetical protein ABIY55_12595, partial [Kofleriaceae bacterium]